MADYVQEGLQSDDNIREMLLNQLEAVWNQEYEILMATCPVLNQTNLATPIKVLDVGCGVGAFACKFAQTFPNAIITGIDLEERNVRQAQQLAAESHENGKIKADQCRFFAADAYYLFLDNDCSTVSPIRDEINTFDIVCCRSTLYAVNKPEKIIEQLLLAAKPQSGILHLLVEDYGMLFAHPTQLDNPRYWREGTCAALANTGTNPFMARKTFHIAYHAVHRVFNSPTLSSPALNPSSRSNSASAASLSHSSSPPSSSTPPSSSSCSDAACASNQGPEDVPDIAALATIGVDYVHVDSCRTDRRLLASIFRSWLEGYAEFVEANTKLSRQEVEDNLKDLIECTLRPDSYVCWQLLVCTVSLHLAKDPS